MREVGIFSSTGNLFAIGKVPVTYKPQFSEGAGKDLVIKVILEVSNASAVTLRVDPSVVLASKKYVDDSMEAHSTAADPHPNYLTGNDLDEHINSPDPHPAYALDTDITSHNTNPTAHQDIRNEVAGKANIDHQHPAYAPVRDSYRNLMINNNTTNPNSRLDISADEIILQDTNGNSLRVSDVNHTVDITLSGANGLDTGTRAASTWYHIWEIAKADGTKAGLLSTSATSPTMPNGYTYRAYLGAVYNNSSNNFITMRQIDNKVVTMRVSVLHLGRQTSYTAISLSTVIPPTAKKVTGTIWVYSPSVEGYLYVSPLNNGIGERFSVCTPGIGIGAPFSQVILTPQTIFYRVGGSPTLGRIDVSGWEY